MGREKEKETFCVKLLRLAVGYCPITYPNLTNVSRLYDNS